MSGASHIDRLRRTVADLGRSIDFYRGGLGFELERGDADMALLRLGEQRLELVRHTGPAPLPPGAIAPNPRFQHAAIVTSNMDVAWRRVETHGAVPISRSGPQVLPANTGGVAAVKFRDPDGHPLELIRFPAGVGDPRWQAVGTDEPNLGIDHFALVVVDDDRSIAWLARTLGFDVSNRGLNQGVEQDRLDGLDGAIVDVISLVPRVGAGTPHVELLRYRHPAVQTSSVAAFDLVGRDEIVCVVGHPTADTEGRHVDPDGHVFRVVA